MFFVLLHGSDFCLRDLITKSLFEPGFDRFIELSLVGLKPKKDVKQVCYAHIMLYPSYVDAPAALVLWAHRWPGFCQDESSVEAQTQGVDRNGKATWSGIKLLLLTIIISIHYYYCLLLLLKLLSLLLCSLCFFVVFVRSHVLFFHFFPVVFLSMVHGVLLLAIGGGSKPVDKGLLMDVHYADATGIWPTPVWRVDSCITWSLRKTFRNRLKRDPSCTCLACDPSIWSHLFLEIYRMGMQCHCLCGLIFLELQGPYGKQPSNKSKPTYQSNVKPTKPTN